MPLQNSLLAALTIQATNLEFIHCPLIVEQFPKLQFSIVESLVGDPLHERSWQRSFAVHGFKSSQRVPLVLTAQSVTIFCELIPSLQAIIPLVRSLKLAIFFLSDSFLFIDTLSVLDFIAVNVTFVVFNFCPIVFSSFL
jgi:hypothetical protein